MPWLVLAVAFVLFKENRRAPALWILVPLLAAKGAWAAVVALTGMPSGSSTLFAMPVNAVLISFAVLWLFSEKLSRVPRLLKWPLAFVLFAVVAGASAMTLGYDSQTRDMLIFAIIAWSVLLSALPFGALMARKKWHPVRFAVWAAVWMLVTAQPLIFLFAAIETGRLPSADLLLRVVMVALVVGGILTAVLLPFEILCFTSGFWRQRFEKLLLVQTKPASKPVEQPEPVAES